MPRKARLHVPGVVYHVMSRGIEGRAIFADDEDREEFLDLFARGLRKTGFRCYAWVLMENHYHLVLRINKLPLWRLFKPLNGTYAKRFGRRHGRHGYLFQERFKSIATQDQNYVQELIGYVHLNPLRAGVCNTLGELDTYPWSGHRALAGIKSCPFQEVASVLRFFGKTRQPARARYRQFLCDILDREDQRGVFTQLRDSNRNREMVHDPGCWVIGKPEFVRKAVSSDKKRRLRVARHAKEGLDLEALAGLVAKQFGIVERSMLRRTRRRLHSDARKVFAFLAHRELDFPVRRIADFLGISSPAVSVMVEQGSAIAENHEVRRILNY